MTSRDLAHHARLVMTRSPRRSAERWRRALPGPRIGACAAWPRQLATPPQRSIASGRPSACSRIAARRSSCRAIRCSSRKCATLSDCISTHRIVRWCCVSMKSHRFRRSTGPSRYCRCGRGKPSGTHDYKRHGTISLFAALDVQVGKVIGRCFRRHRAQEFRKFLDTVETQVPDDLDVHLIIDNAGTHKTARIRSWFAKRPRWHVDFTPTSASWINLVERFFGLLTAGQVRRGVHRSTAELEAAIHAYIEAHNANLKPFRWVKSADDILAAVDRFCRRTLKTNATLRRT